MTNVTRDYFQVYNIENAYINNCGRTPPLKIGDFGDQSYPLRILSLIKTILDLNTCPGLKIGDFDDPSDPANKTQHAF